MIKRRSHGEGNIEKRGQKRFRLRYRNGAKKLIAVTFKGTEAQARTELRALLAAVDANEHIDPVKTPFKDWAKDWLAMLERNPDQKRGLVSVRTRERYKASLDHVMPALGDVQLQKITAMALNKVYAELERTLAPRTVKNIHVLLKACLGEAVRQRMLKFNPAELAHPPRPENVNIATILDASQLVKLRNGFRGHPLEGIVMTVIMTGMRRGEISALRWCDVDLDKGLIMVTRAVEVTNRGTSIKGPKTSRGRRVVTIDSVLVAKLREIRDEQLLFVAGVPAGSEVNLGLVRLDPETLIFPGEGTDLTKLRNCQSITKVFIRRAKRILGIKLRFHDLRASHLTLLIDNGTPIPTVAARAGHSANVLLSNYAKWTRKGDEKASEVLAVFSRDMA
jgi:integrase